MGYIRHNAIIVTSYDYDKISEAYDIAKSIFRKYGISRLVGPIIGSVANEYKTFFIAPDGSKEGWDISNAGNDARDEFIHWLQEDYCYDWAEIQYGDEVGNQCITSASNMGEI